MGLCVWEAWRGEGGEALWPCMEARVASGQEAVGSCSTHWHVATAAGCCGVEVCFLNIN